ncbi:hypothetical protein [Streptomyces indiaensis]|uniref:Sel1 repeat family protein n=1 Tax=Streptomyces indiaensis TaxID=284033 RepID=A0ABN3DFY4_9ACTN|nr:hypothetical protein [Streptomyces indiaensis]MCF1644548.1 hypothetical protein [Streptomyces indiaensis]
MAARRLLRIGESDPHLELAAEAGDVGAMTALGSHLRRSPGRWDRAERWLVAAAEAGGPEAMHCLSTLYWERAVWEPNGEAYRARSVYWCRRAAQAGWFEAVQLMGTENGISTEEREFWLRRALEGGDRSAMTGLARLARERERPDEAEHWYRMAIDHGLSYVRGEWAFLLLDQGRPNEAEECVRREAEAGSWEAAGHLAAVLRRLGRTQEAATWQAKCDAGHARDTEREMREGEASPRHAPPGDLVAVVVTALVTTAVVPFIQALVSKAAEDSYGQARGLVLRMLHRNGEPEATAEPVEECAGEEEPGLLIADDAEVGIALILWSNASDEALRALSSLDLDELTARRPDQGRVRLVWHPATGRWHIRGSQRS